MARTCKVFRWISKAGDATICRRPKLDDDNNSVIFPNSTDTHTSGCKNNPSYNITHETGEREIWRNKVGEVSTSTSSSKENKKARKRHKSLPVPSWRSSQYSAGSSSNKKLGLVVDTRRFCMVDPFNMGGNRRSFVLDTPWNITAFFASTADNINHNNYRSDINLTVDNNNGDKKSLLDYYLGEESPATILIAKKENLTRNSRFSVQPVRRKSNRRSIAKEIRGEVRTFRWENRHHDREKTSSQLYELYEKFNEKYNDSLLFNLSQDKPLPPIPNDVSNHTTITEESETNIDPELLSIIDTLSLISEYHSSMESPIDDDSIIYTQTSTARESFSELLINEEIISNPFEEDPNVPVAISSANSIRDSIYSVETLPVDVEMCLLCKRRSTDSGYSIHWCKTCETKRFEQQFESWSSGNDDIDCFILESQLNSSSFFDYLEWIPFDRLQDISLVGTGDRSCVFQAIWLDGPRERWDIKNNQFVRCGECLVALKYFEDSQNFSSDFFEQLSKNLQCDSKRTVRCYGITQDPKSKEYMLVLQYASDGNISDYLKQNFADITWKKRLEILYSLAKGLNSIHENNLIHGNLHGGNVLINDSSPLISDHGMSHHPTYGVLPFIAPELLSNKPYTMAADIYSFGMIMWELVAGKKPFADRAHDEKLATEICRQGLRPEIPTDVPECYVRLLKRCWAFNPFIRPCANQLCETIGEWIDEISENTSSAISIQFQRSETKRLESVEQRVDDDDHPEAVYTSRSFNFENLHEPNVVFTKSFDPKEHLAIQQYIANETRYYNLKINTIKAENSNIAAEIHDILRFL